MDSKKMWNYLVDEHTKYLNASEKEIQEKWEKEYLLDAELFGYSKAMGDVDSQRSLHIGSSDRAIPDIILRKDGKDLFVIELKQYSLRKNSDFEKQLLSYLTHTDIHLSIGVLVCNKLCLCFHNHSSNQTQWLEIPFEKDNALGAKFVELFSKENFSEENIKEFIAQKIRSAQNIKNLREEIGNAKEMVIEFLENEFAPKYGKAEFDEVMNEFEIQIVKKAKETSVAFAPKAYRAIVHAHYDDGESTFSKSDAIKLCRKNGFANSGEITFSSTNKGNGVFWSNPNVRLLSEDWWLLLNDKEEEKLYVLFVPRNSINHHELLVRADKPNLIDLQIKNDGSFVDSRSEYSFKKYLKTSIKY